MVLHLSSSETIHNGCPGQRPPSSPSLRLVNIHLHSQNHTASAHHSIVPGSSQRMLDKSRSLVADCVAYDLEDSVTPSRKEEARYLVRQAIDQPAPPGIRERAVRINSVDSGLALADLTEVVRYPTALLCRNATQKKLTPIAHSSNPPT